MRAGNGTRTRDPLFTRQVLYQLSYSGAVAVRDGPSAEGIAFACAAAGHRCRVAEVIHVAAAITDAASRRHPMRAVTARSTPSCNDSPRAG